MTRPDTKMYICTCFGSGLRNVTGRSSGHTVFSHKFLEKVALRPAFYSLQAVCPPVQHHITTRDSSGIAANCVQEHGMSVVMIIRGGQILPLHSFILHCLHLAWEARQAKHHCGCRRASYHNGPLSRGCTVCCRPECHERIG